MRAILLDVDGTLFRHAEVRRRILTRLLRACALHPVRGARVLRALAAYRAAQETLRREGASVDSADTQILLACRATGLSEPFVRATAAQWMETEPLPMLRAAMRPHLTEFLLEARQSGIRLGVCSDYPPAAKLQAMGVEGLFEAVVWAQQAGVERLKPHPQMLLEALRQLDAEPNEAVFVGDRDEVDGAAARAAGVPFILIGKRVGFVELSAALATRPRR